MKTNVSNMKNDKYPSFGPDFGLFGRNLGPKIFFMDFTSTGCYELLQAVIVLNLKEN